MTMFDIKSLFKSIILLVIMAVNYIAMIAMGYDDVQALLFANWSMGAYLYMIMKRNERLQP